MKKLLIIIALFCTGNSLISQNIDLAINGLVNSKKTTSVNVTNVNLETVTLQDRRGVSFDAQVYVVNRNQDNRTATLVSAINKGRMFPYATLTTKLADGTVIIHRLTNTFLSNYTSQNNSGQDPTEQFYLRYQTDEIVER